MFGFEQLFEGLGGASGGHFHGHGRGGDSDEGEADTTRYYEVLGVDKEASQEQVKKAYRKACRSLHPDRHPEEREKYQKLFQEMQEAYDVLKDPETRKVYDRYGEKAAKSKSSSDMSRRGAARKAKTSSGATVKRSPPINAVLDCDLEDVYAGSCKEVEVKKRIADESSMKCERCDGEGVCVVVQRMGPMMFQSQQRCRECGGVGYSLKSVTRMVKVNIPVGAKHGEQVTVEGEGHEYPDLAHGNVVVQLRVNKHKLFTRQGADLGMSHTISLRQALLGFEVRIKHVSGSHLLVRNRAGDVVQPGALVVVHTYGMPQRFNAHCHGHLYIAMEVELPKLTTASRRVLKALPGKAADELNPALKDLAKLKADEEKEAKVAAEKSERASGGGSKRGRRRGKKRNINKKPSAAAAPMDVDSEPPYDEEVSAHLVEDGKIRATPATARGHEDGDDEGGQSMECRQM